MNKKTLFATPFLLLLSSCTAQGEAKLDSLLNAANSSSGKNIIKVAKMKHDALLGKDAIAKVKEILGTCDSMGIMVEGKQAREVIADINQGKFVEKIKSGKTELSVEELKKLEQERKNLEEEIKKRRAEYEAKAASIMKALEGKPRGQIKTAMAEAGVPTAIIDQFLPQEAKAEPGAAGAAKK